MAQNIGKRRGKSPTKVTLEQKRKAKRKDPEGYKNFSEDLLGGALFALESAAYGPAAKAIKYGYKTAKKGVKKLTKTIPPERGPVPQGLKNGGCPHRENGVKSPIKGISNIQVKGHKFIGVK
tara:strand:+ start:542 stop:907 length:366 start_codon:yes stop_codon:yes gene_type:complete